MRSGTKQSVREFWNSEACGERYGPDQDRLRYQLEPQISPFADFATSSGKRLLEIGLGMGSDFLRFVRAGADASGIDLTDRAVEITRGRLTSEGLDASVQVADAESLPFPDASFDIVYSWGVLHHTPNTARAVAESLRVLAPGGKLKIMLYHRHSWVAAAAWARFGLLRGRPLVGLRDAVTHIESPGTQAFTQAEVRTMFPEGYTVSVIPSLTHWDRTVAPGLSSFAGNRYGWFLLVQAEMEHGSSDVQPDGAATGA